MLTKELPKLKGTAGSYSVTFNRSVPRLRLRVVPRLRLLSGLTAFAIPWVRIGRPVQTQGESPPSRRLNDYLTDALADIRDSASELPTRVRITSTTETGAYEMDPWDAKNGRRIRLIEKKHHEGLSEKETAELGRLKQEVYEHIQTIDPRPMDAVDEAEERINRLQKRLEAKRGKKA